MGDYRAHLDRAASALAVGLSTRDKSEQHYQDALRAALAHVHAARNIDRGAVEALEAIANWQHDPMDSYSYDAKEMQRIAARALSVSGGSSA